MVKVNENNGMQAMAYEAPQVEIIEVAVEKGFATSGEANPADYEWGGNL